MIVKDNDLIYGVYDRTRGIGGCDDYFGYFKKEKDAKNEMKIQFEHLKSKNPKETFKIYKDRTVRVKEKTEEILIIIHPILLR
jgi:hypothetical protein